MTNDAKADANMNVITNPQALGKVGVLMGGRSAEREISLRSGNGVLGALLKQGVDAQAFDPALQSIAELAAAKFDRVFIALHGRYGEDGSIQGVLEWLGVPYTGSGVMASALAMDKQAAKRMWLNWGLTTPKFAMLTAQSDWQAVAQTLGLPLFVKPASEGSSIGLSKVTDVAQLPEAYAKAAKLGGDVIAEEFIDGMELTCPVLGVGAQAQALPVVRILAPEGNYDYQNKYFKNDTQYLCPSELPPALESEVQQLVVDAYRALNCRGWGRADVIVRKSDNRPFLIEMNTSPGMTDHSLAPMAARVAGYSYEEFVLKVLQSADLDLHPDANWKPE